MTWNLQMIKRIEHRHSEDNKNHLLINIITSTVHCHIFSVQCFYRTLLYSKKNISNTIIGSKELKNNENYDITLRYKIKTNNLLTSFYLLIWKWFMRNNKLDLFLKQQHLRLLHKSKWYTFGTNKTRQNLLFF